LYEFYTAKNIYLSEKEIRKKLGYKTSIHNLLNKLVDKGFLSIWDSAGEKGVNLYRFNNNIKRSQKTLSKLWEEIRPKYYCKECKRVHFRDSDIGNIHLKYKDKGEGKIIWEGD